MDFLGVVINYILNLGAPVFVPFIMLLAGLVVRMKFRDAASAAITLGVAFVGMSMLIGFMVDAIGVAAQTMMQRTGLELSIVDGGWTTMANISWAWPYAFAMFPLQVGVNIVMLMLNKTNTFNADLWNVWGKIFTAFIVVSVTTPLFGPARVWHWRSGCGLPDHYGAERWRYSPTSNRETHRYSRRNLYPPYGVLWRHLLPVRFTAAQNPGVQ